MSAINNGDFTAFPLRISELAHYPGLTKREYFAALALQGLLAGGNFNWEVFIATRMAVKYADALIKELEREVTE